MRKIYLSVVIPAYNEQANLKKGVLASVEDYLKNQKYTWEVLIVDDGSTDTTVELAEKFAGSHKGFKVLKEPHRGKGGSVIAGMLKGRGEVILFTDMDQATPINQLEKLLPKIRNGFDVAIGSRSGREGAPLVRKVMAQGWIILRTLILQLPFKDTQCGFKLFKRDAAKQIFSKIKIFSKKMIGHGASVTAGFDLEVLYVARKMGVKIAEVPVEWYDDRVRVEVSPFKDSWEGLRDLLKVRINSLKGNYKA